jgi:hypothetical protein
LSRLATLPPTAITATDHEAKVRLLSVLIAITYSVSLLFVASALRTSYGFPLDDSYIHQTIARNFARSGVLGFVPGEPSSGATSVLWAFIQTANYKLFHINPVLFNLILSWIILVAIGLTLFTLAQRDGLPTPYSLAFAAAPALCGNFIWLALVGMEHLLFVAVTLGCIHYWTDQENKHRALWAGTCAGILALIRPEAIIFGPLLAIVGWKQIRVALSMFASWSAFVIILLSMNFYTSHSLMPGTLNGRAWLYFHLTGGPHSLRSRLVFMFQWLVRLQMQFSIEQNFILLRILVPLGLAIAGAAWLIRRGGMRIRLILLFAAAHFSMFLLQFPSLGQGGRYQPLNLLLLFPCMFFGMLFLLRRMIKRQIAAAITIAAVVVAGIASLHTWRIVSMDGIAHINNTHARAAQWLANNVSASSTVAVFDIGRISYDWNHRIIDLGGLVDPAYTPHLLNHSVPAYVQEQKADYLILPSGPLSVDLGFTKLFALTQLAKFCSPLNLWQISAYFSANAAQCQVIYKLP